MDGAWSNIISFWLPPGSWPRVCVRERVFARVRVCVCLCAKRLGAFVCLCVSACVRLSAARTLERPI